MITLPIPLFGAVVLGFLLVKLWITDRRFGPLAWLLALCAVQSFVISMGQHYGIIGFRLLQPVLASMIPLAAWAAFVRTTRRPLHISDAAHLLVPLIALLALLVQPYALDVLIPLTFAAYGIAILWTCRAGTDALPLLRLDNGSSPLTLWTVMAAILLFSAFSDVFIIALAVTGLGWLQPYLISAYSALNLLVIGGLSLSDALKTNGGSVPAPAARPTAGDAMIFEALQQTMDHRRPYLDPDLTLIKLARITGIPSKKLSAAINRATGDNVSRYINGARISAAQNMLRQGQSVTTTLYDAGFNTKSNFNREFLRVTGLTPSGWLAGEETLAPAECP